MNKLVAFVGMASVLGLAGCGGDNTASNVTSPGAKESATTKVLEAGAAALQDKSPIDALNAYLDGFHFYNGRMQGQMEAHHYCAIVNDELIQCVIYDGNVKDAKIMGVEYIVSERLFKGLPENEKALWHSHAHEVKSGQLIAPGIPEVAEHALMARLVGTYGKTWHTWHTDLQKDLPIGVPQLMMGFTADGQIDQGMVDARNRRFGVSTEAERKKRADIPLPAIADGADAWQRGGWCNWPTRPVRSTTRRMAHRRVRGLRSVGLRTGSDSTDSRRTRTWAPAFAGVTKKGTVPPVVPAQAEPGGVG